LTRKPLATLLVDGQCGVCCWGGIHLAARIDGLAVATIQQRLQRELAALGQRRALASWHLVEPGRIASGADVVPALLELAGHSGGAALGRALLPLLRPAYRSLAATRTLWARAVPADRRTAARARLAAQGPLMVAARARLPNQ